MNLYGGTGPALRYPPDGWENHLPTWPSIVDVANANDLAELKLRKKAWKESQA